MKYLVRFYLLSCWLFFIFVLLTAPMTPGQGNSFTYYDKFAHAFLFGVMAFLIVYFLNLFPRIKIEVSILVSIFLSIAYSALTEYLQLFIPGRSMSEYDLLAGAAGVFIASLIVYEKYGKK